MRSAEQTLDMLSLQARLLEHEDRLRRLIEKRFPPILRSVYSVEDVLQEIWICAFRSISGFYAESHDAFERWLTSLATHRIINLAKSARSEKRGLNRRHIGDGWNPRSSYLALFEEIAGKGRTPSREAFTLETATVLRNVLTELSEDRRRAIEMRYIEGRSLDDTAAIMGRSKRAIRSLAYNGIQQIRARLGHASHFFSDAPSTQG